MFGRRKVPPGLPPVSPPPPPGGTEPFPIDKMDRALDGAIRLFTKALDDAGVDAGGLAIRGAVPHGVSGLVADCTTYRGENDGGLTYLALGVTPDFKAFSYAPHCRLYFILNSTGICEDPVIASSPTMLKDLAPGQLPGPLLDAHLLRCWIGFIRQTGEAMSGGATALDSLFERMARGLLEVVRRVPAEWTERLAPRVRYDELTGGFPGTIGRPLDDTVTRMNGLPMTPFISDILIEELARLQMRGLSDRG